VIETKAGDAAHRVPESPERDRGSQAPEISASVLMEPAPVGWGRTVSGNVITNIAARMWAACLQIVFTPVYIALLGPEAYGLISFYTVLVITLSFLDQAVSPPLIREFARLSSERDKGREMRDLLRTLEVITTLAGVIIGAGVFVFAPEIAMTWLKPGNLPHDRVEVVIRLMGLGLACQWPSFLYSGGYIGLNRQQMLTRLRIIGLSVQWGGAALALWAIGPWVELFFIWQIFSFAFLSIMLAVGLWRLLPTSPYRPLASVGNFRRIWRFSAGTFVIGFTASVLTQADKLVVSSVVPLDQFAAYSLCFMLVMLISNFIASPMASSLFPHFTQLISEGKQDVLAFEYHRWTQFLMVLLLPACGVLLVFSKPLLEVWLGGNSKMIEEMTALMPWVVLGTLFSTVTLFPFCLQIASGWTRLSAIKNFVAIAVILPILILEVPRLGPIVGAWCWFALNFGYYTLEVPIMHRRLLRGEMVSWWLRDTLLPGGIAAAFFYLVAEAVRPMALSPWASVFVAMITGFLALLLLALTLPHPRALLKQASRRFMSSLA
jgi:O-antigen/teichoic acid export membrane protein